MSAPAADNHGTDVVVIGGGPAGCSAAIAAARAGARVMLCERSVFPRSKVCGCCLAPAGVAALDALGAATVLAGARRLESVRVSSGGRAAVLRRRDGGVVISREVLDTRLMQRAVAEGVDVRMGVSAQVCGAGRVRLRGDAAGEPIVCRTVIVADGLGGSALDGVDGFDTRVARRSHMGFGATLPPHAVDCAEGEVHLRVSAGGYIGLVRLPDGSVDVAAAVAPELLRSAREVARCAEDLLGGSVRDAQALRAARWMGTPQLTRRRGRIAGEGILVVGDSAGYEEPFTGEGMAWAIETGRAAGALAARSRPGRIEASERTPESEWPALHARLVGRSRLRCRAIATVLRSPFLSSLLIGIATRMPRPFEYLAGSIGREAHG